MRDKGCDKPLNKFKDKIEDYLSKCSQDADEGQKVATAVVAEKASSGEDVDNSIEKMAVSDSSGEKVVEEVRLEFDT